MKERSARREILKIFEYALSSVLPENLIKNKIELERNELRIGGKTYSIEKGFYVFGSGKASARMAKALEDNFIDFIKGGMVVSKRFQKLQKVEVLEGSHPIPSEKSVYAARKIVESLKSLNENDFFVYLLSGGSSALLELPLEPVTLEDLRAVTDMLLRNGVPIDELNAVRKHLSQVKGGRLARLTKAKGVVLVISDVIGDDLETIGSAPLYMDRTTYEDVYNIFKKYDLWDKIPESVKRVVKLGLEGEIEETPKTPPRNIEHHIIGCNSYMLKRAKEKAESLGYNSYIMTTSLHGEAREVAKVLVSIAREIKESNNPFKKPACLLFGGETTVTVSGSGRGGRCQEMALSALKEIKGLSDVVFLSAGTDGTDGNSDAAGALIDEGDYLRALDLGLNIDEYLKNNDSYTFLKRLDCLIFTGDTGTNVMDIQILIVK